MNTNFFKIIYPSGLIQHVWDDAASAEAMIAKISGLLVHEAHALGLMVEHVTPASLESSVTAAVAGLAATPPAVAEAEPEVTPPAEAPVEPVAAPVEPPPAAAEAPPVPPETPATPAT